MVFESVLTQVLNRVLGAYVENLDTNQLRVGIWGGDVELNNLVLKQSALDDLDLPLQTIYGRIGKLVLKIPWKNLYGAAFVINVEDIYLLAAPNQQVIYDEEKENAKKIDAKKKEILQVELAKKQEADKDKPTKADYTFVEKLVTQIIKNIQLNIKNIHIRYEDKVTSPNPFSVGITLSDLDVVSTDESWKPAITKENITKIFKIVALDGLAVYWNCNTVHYETLPKVDLIHKMCTEIASKGNQPSNYTYVLGPINSSARLRINQKPELDKPAYSIPKIHLNLDMERLFIGITKSQYRDIIALAESMDRMSKGTPYRKYRPNVTSYRGHYKEWWKFAYTCILESEVKRRRRNWDWAHIFAHRTLCREYGQLYEKQLLNKATAAELKRIEECEKHVDTFNIVIIRQKREMENERRVKENKEKGWFGWVWGGKSTNKDGGSESGGEIRKQFEEAMSKEEKERLYKAIGYQENAAPSQFPEAYVDTSCTFLLRTLEIELLDDLAEGRVVFTELKGVRCRADTRAAANALKVHVKIDEFTTFGLSQDDFIPRMITSETGAGDSGLLEVTFETNPLDKTCGQRLYLSSQPLQIVYDAQTINKVIDIFKVPSSSALDQLSAAADSGLSNIKEMSSSGLQHAIDTHVHLDLKVDLRAPYIIIPYGGKYTENENVLVVNLGNFQMHSLDRPPRKDVRKMYAEGTDEKEILKQLIAQSYDRFEVQLTQIQVMIAQSTEDWKSHMKDTKTTDMHILDPINFKLNLSKCMISDDPKLPLMKLTGELPSIVVNVTDARLLLLVTLGKSIPLPKSDVPEPVPLGKSVKRESSMMLRYLEMQEKAAKTKQLLPQHAAGKKDELVQFTTVQMHFVMSELSLNIKHQTDVDSPISNVVSVSAKSLELGFVQQTYNTRITLGLATIGLIHHNRDQELKVISSPGYESGEQLFQIKFTQVDKTSPEFHSTYKSCEISLVLEFAKLGVVLHKEALLDLIQFATNLQQDIFEVWGDESTERIATTSPGFRKQLSVISESLTSQTALQAEKKKSSSRVLVETIKFKLIAGFRELSVEFTTAKAPISFWALQGINTDIVVKASYTQINFKLNQIAIMDLNPETIHSTILSVEGQEAIAGRIVLYEVDKTVESERADISVDLTMGGVRIVFLNWFVSRMLEFLNEFQTAQAAIIEASQAAAKSAKENVQNVYAKATRLSLSVDLKAPDIIIPENSKSLDAVLVDLGRISISNKFLTLDIKNEKNFSAVIDEMKLSLTNMKLSRIRLNKRNETEKELPLLIPLTFKLTIKRNLTSSWYKAVPDIDITGRIFSINVLLSQLDYKTIMSILNGNLAEGNTDKAPVSPNPTPLTSKQSFDSQKKDKVSQTAVSDKSSQLEFDKESKADAVLRFTFTMDNVVLSLFTGGSKALSSDSPSHNEQDGLARFSLEGISVKARVLSDDSISASLLLLNCFLDDMRKGREDKLNRLVQRATDEGLPRSVSMISTSTNSDSTPLKSMLDLIVQVNKKNIFADVRVYSFTVILSVDYLLKIADFLTIPQEEATQNAVATKPGAGAASKMSMSVPIEVETVQESQITLNLKIEKPDIILVEHMDSIDTQAMILNSEILIKLRLAGPHQVINGTIKDLQLYTCNYNELRNADTRSNVLHPVTISLAGSTPEDKGLHVELLITDIRLSVSPATIELISRVVATATGQGVTKTSNEDEFEDHSNVWDPKPFQESDYWFFKTDDATEAVESLSGSVETTKSKRLFQEMCILSMPSIIITIEAGVGSKTLPMLILESSLKGNVCNWSSQLSVDAVATLQMNYYNSRLALWEPLIEPVEVIRHDRSVLVPWELKLEASMNEKDELTTPTEGYEVLETQQAVMSIDIMSDHSMELVVTKTCLEVLNNLGKAFANAMKPGEMKPLEVAAPYKIINELGTSVTVNFDRGSFVLFQDEDRSEVILETGAEAHLQRKVIMLSTSPRVGMQLAAEALIVKNYFVNVRVDDKNCDLDLPVVRADKRYFPLNYRGEGNDHWGLISEVRVEDGVTIITLRSILQVHNHFNIPIEVYYMTSRGNELASITTVEPGSHFNVPLKSVYTRTNELFFAMEGYSVTSIPYIWKDLQTNLTVTKTLHCSPKDVATGNEPFIIQAVGEMEQVYFENTARHTMSSTCYNIHLKPAVVFKNYLPIDIVCCVENMSLEIPVEPGKTLLLPNVEPGTSCLVIRLPCYLEKVWSTRQEVSKNPSEFSVWTFNSYDSAVQMCLSLGMHVVNEKGSVVMGLYCPFWMLNKTGLMLGYRGSEESVNVLHHPATFKGPILFSFNAKNFFGKKKAAIKVEQGEWSDKFSLDVAGSSGVVVCKFNNVLYQIGVSNQLTYNGLTKQVTFTPYYVIINNASFVIECQENDRPADAWIAVEPESCTALWPKSELDDKLLRLRVKGTQEVSAAFLYTESHTSLLKLKNKYGGISVDIQISEGASYINIASYEDGTAPALIINHTKDTMNFWEKESVQIRKLAPNNCMLYTWENPSGPRILAWEGAHKKEHSNDLRKDEIAEYSLSDDYKIFWVSFLDGMQRILLFTQDEVVARNAQAAKLFEMFQQEITVSIYGVGLSLVNNVTRQEIMYMAIASSGIIWEQCKTKGKRFKALSSGQSLVLEAAYQRFIAEEQEGQNPIVSIDSKMEVDFHNYVMLKPNKRTIRRTFQTGLWLQMRTSPSQVQLHAKINRLQIDNQMYDCIFPVVLAPVPPPKSVAVNSGIKPFAELSIVQLLMKNTQIKQFKYFKLLVQEFHIKVDLGFINALVDILQTAQYTDAEEQQLFLTDVQLVDQPLYAHVSTQSMQEQKSFYDLLHFSPLKIHVSFSLAAGSSVATAETPNFVNVLLQGLGVTLTDLQDVVFRLAYFEREYTFLTQKQLVSEATSHYVGQAVKQLYVLVLGLDVLGNPYGLVRGITKGVEDLFYEPFQGAIQGPEEFAEGLVLGVMSLFGHTVGGAAGAVSRITGAMGKGIAVLTFDKDYQRKRRGQINKKPATVQEGIARSGKSLVMGVVDGVTGVFTKPISGAKEEGVGGFFKGLGKGAVGLIARPTAGVVDFASGSLDAVKRAAETSDETSRLRPPRYLQGDGLVRPYNKHESQGQKLLIELEKGKYATTDVYVAHYHILENREVLLLTDKRLAYICHSDIFGGWQVDWSYTWQEIKHPPNVISKGVAIAVTDKKKKLGLLGSSDSGKIILVGDPVKREEICAKIEQLRGDA